MEKDSKTRDDFFSRLQIQDQETNDFFFPSKEKEKEQETSVPVEDQRQKESPKKEKPRAKKDAAEKDVQTTVIQIRKSQVETLRIIETIWSRNKGETLTHAGVIDKFLLEGVKSVSPEIYEKVKLIM